MSFSLARPALLVTTLATLAACAGGLSSPQKVAASRPAAPYPGQPTGTSSQAGSYDTYQPAPAYDSHASMGGGGGGDIAIDRPAPMPEERPGLGTTWGESVYSPVTTSPFQRSSISPWATAVIHYNDADGVRAHATHVGGTLAPLEALVGDGSIGVSLVADGGGMLPGIRAGGRNLVVGEDGARYRILVRNATSVRFEVVASVDGLDVIDGKPADPNRRGYIVDPGDVLVIDGFRTTDAEVAAFRFGKVASSYAARTSGDNNVGVIGFAVFAEKGAIWTPAELQRRDQADPFPARGYAAPPR